MFSPIVFEGENSNLIDYIHDSHSCLDIVHVDDIMPYSPVEYLDIENKYYHSWFQMDNGQLFQSKNNFNSIVTRSQLAVLRRVPPMKVYQAENEDLAVTFIPFFVSSVCHFDVDDDLGIEPDAWLRRSNSSLAGEIRIQHGMRADVSYTGDKRAVATSTSLWHGIIRIENRSRNTKYMRSIQHTFRSIDQPFHQRKETVALAVFPHVRERIEPNGIHQYSCQFSLYQPNMEMDMTIAYRRGRRNSSMIIKSVNFEPLE